MSGEVNMPTKKQGAKVGAMKRKGLSDAAAKRIAGIKTTKRSTKK